MVDYYLIARLLITIVFIIPTYPFVLMATTICCFSLTFIPMGIIFGVLQFISRDEEYKESFEFAAFGLYTIVAPVHIWCIFVLDPERLKSNLQKL